MPTIDLVADVGESFGAYRMGDDERLLTTLTSANIACGFHAGDPRTMDASVRACVDHDVAIGAHPSFPDLAGFGRRAMDLTRDELRTDVLYQVGALEAFARANGTAVRHLSPHGMLGNLVMSDPRYAAGVADAVEAYDAALTIFTLPGELVGEARKRGLRVVVMGAIDRALEDDGRLVSRREPGAVLHDVAEIVDRALSLAVDGRATSRNGNSVEVECQSLLLHGDNLASIEAAEQVRAALDREGVSIAAPSAPRMAG
ncbi:MAG: LamB/YcsF family protein [Marmoricola sp.]|nr:LamB/YcsF family protein [Marmoricola sp.]